jgi:hypothetical protein
MARNLAQRLDRLERLAAELLNTNQGPVYVREGTAIPENVSRVFLDPPEQPAEHLPEVVEASPAIERASPSFNRPLATPPLGIQLSRDF